ncbi:hypothetical protein BDD12DRAFT_878379 [Trichophaea hybrida]|nr:hypothetical protein BDD12DRAFT_878379 [Trichophaea hybrida]
MVSIKSIFVIALASFAIASPIFPLGEDDHSSVSSQEGHEFGEGDHSDFNPKEGHEFGKEGDEDNFLSDNDLFNGDLASPNKDDMSQNDLKSIQHNECGPKGMYVSCCNNGHKKASGLLGTNLDLLNAQCSMLLPGLEALSLVHLPIGNSFKSEQCKQEAISCCSSGNVNQKGFINVNKIDALNCSPIKVFGKKL